MSVYKRYNGKKITRADPNYKNARWYYRFYVNKVLYHNAIPEAQTQKQAEDAEKSIRLKIFNNRYNPKADRTTFAEFVETVYKPYSAENNRNSRNIEVYLKSLLKAFGKSPLREITPSDVRKYQTKRKHTKNKLGTVYAPASINREMSVLSKIFTLAFQDELIERNPCALVPKLKEADARQRLLTADERTRLLTEASKDPTLYNIIIIAINTGLRKGQILAIKAEDFDAENFRLKVIASKRKPARIIPINQTVQTLLSELCRDRKGYIFTGAKTRRKLGSIEKRWYKVLDDAEIKDFHFHDLRHCFASDLMRKNVHPILIKDLLFHSSMDMTERYITTDETLLFDAINRLDSAEITDLSGISN